MGNKEELQLTLEGLNCANCARKIEEKVGRMEGVKESNLNFTTTTLNVKLEKKVKEEHVISEIKKINIISIAVDAPQDLINSLTGSLGRLDGITAKAAYSKI